MPLTAAERAGTSAGLRANLELSGGPLPGRLAAGWFGVQPAPGV